MLITSIATAVLLLAVVLLALPGLRERPPLRWLAGSQPSDIVVVDDGANPPYGFRGFDAAQGHERSIVLPNRRPGDWPYPVTYIDGEFIYQAWPGSAPVIDEVVNAFSLKDGRVRLLGRNAYMVPDTASKFIWLVSGEFPGTDVRAVKPDGQSLTTTIKLPQHTWPVAAIDGKLILSDSSSRLALWDPRSGLTERTFDAGSVVVASRSGVLVIATSCKDGVCAGLLWTSPGKGGLDHRLGPPTDKEAKGWIAEGGLRPEENLSPDGAHLAIGVRVSPLGVGATETSAIPSLPSSSHIALVDLSSGRTSRVPSSEFAYYPFVAWSLDSRWVFFAEGNDQIGEYNIDTRASRAVRGCNCDGGFLVIPKHK